MGRSKENKLLVDGQKLTNARIAANVRQQDLAEKLGCNKSAICRFEQGSSTPTDEQIEAMARMLKTRDFILNGKVK